jgi:hypothetical protein
VSTDQNRTIRNAVPVATYTATFNTPSMDVSQVTQYVNVEVVTTAVTGTTPSLVLVGQWSFDGGTSWSSSDGGGDTWNAITANGQKMRQMTPKGPLFRLNGTITGTTPSFTVAVNLNII